MHEINLFPWREKRQLQQKKMFCTLFLLLLLISGCLVALGSQYLSRLINAESLFIFRIKDEIRGVETRIIQMERSKLQILTLYPHIKTLEKLSRESRLVLHLLPGLLKILPDGVNLNHLKRHGDTIELNGYAQSEEDIAKLMVSIPNNRWIEKPILEKVLKPKDELPYTFKLQFTLKTIRTPRASAIFASIVKSKSREFKT